MATNALKSQLARQKVAFGGFIQIGHPAIGEIFARAGLGWSILDCEHGVIDLESGTNLMRAMSRWSCDALARLPRNDPVWIARFLDAGAAGIVVPMVNSARDAEQAVAAAKYPPQGHRGFGYGRANDYGVEFDTYARCANSDTSVIVQIEHVLGVEQIDAILSVEGIDGIFVGPYDLSGSMGIPGQLDHQKMADALSQIAAASQAHQVPAGLHIVGPQIERVRQAIANGFRIIALGMDTTLLYHGAHELLTQATALANA